MIYADSHRGEREDEVKRGDKVLIKQRKTTVKPPWNPELYTLPKVKGSQITASKGKEKKVRDIIMMFKLLKERLLGLRAKILVKMTDVVNRGKYCRSRTYLYVGFKLDDSN